MGFHSRVAYRELIECTNWFPTLSQLPIKQLLRRIFRQGQVFTHVIPKVLMHVLQLALIHGTKPCSSMSRRSEMGWNTMDGIAKLLKFIKRKITPGSWGDVIQSSDLEDPEVRARKGELEGVSLKRPWDGVAVMFPPLILGNEVLSSLSPLRKLSCLT
jgi:hypothetical protein